MTNAAPILTVERLAVSFDPRSHNPGAPRVQAVSDASMTLYPGQTLAVVGESGSGKSVTALSTLRLIPSPPSRIERGRILYHDDQHRDTPLDLLTVPDRQMRSLRGGQIGMIFQEPMTSLNPVYTVGEQLIEAVRLHRPFSNAEAREVALSAMAEVGIVSPDKRFHAYPHQFSGGMRQRVMIAMALACQPRVLLADEPTTALDVTVQAQILQLLQTLQRERGLAIMLITHALGVVAQNADVVAVMYAGRVVEYATVENLFRLPTHPYTRGLLSSIPHTRQRAARLTTIRELIQDQSQFLTLGQGLRPWWPEHQPPETATLEPQTQLRASLRQVRPGHWVNLWNTPDALALPAGQPDLASIRSRAGKVVSTAY